MRMVMCDKCGKEIVYFCGQQTIFPYYSIIACYGVYDHRKIDLCNKCQDDLYKWICGKERKNEQ